MATKKSGVMFGYTRTPTILAHWLGPLEDANRGFVEKTMDLYLAINFNMTTPIVELSQDLEELAYMLNSTNEKVTAYMADRRTREAIEGFKVYLNEQIVKRQIFLEACKTGGENSGDVRRGRTEGPEDSVTEPSPAIVAPAPSTSRFNSKQYEGDEFWDDWESLTVTYCPERIKPEHYLVFRDRINSVEPWEKKLECNKIIEGARAYRAQNKEGFAGLWLDKFIIDGEYKKFASQPKKPKPVKKSFPSGSLLPNAWEDNEDNQ
jgi:hypothetical protein